MVGNTELLPAFNGGSYSQGAKDPRCESWGNGEYHWTGTSWGGPGTSFLGCSGRFDKGRRGYSHKGFGRSAKAIEVTQSCTAGGDGCESHHDLGELFTVLATTGTVCWLFGRSSWSRRFKDRCCTRSYGS